MIHNHTSNHIHNIIHNDNHTTNKAAEMLELGLIADAVFSLGTFCEHTGVFREFEEKVFAFLRIISRFFEKLTV